MNMQKAFRVMAGLSLLAALPQIQAAEVPALAEAKDCMSCHSVDKDMAKAPSFRSIAKKYKGVANAEAMLVQKVKVGGVGHWGPSPMPGAGARPQVSEDEAKTLVTWVLSLH